MSFTSRCWYEPCRGEVGAEPGRRAAGLEAARGRGHEAARLEAARRDAEDELQRGPGQQEALGEPPARRAYDGAGQGAYDGAGQAAYDGAGQAEYDGAGQGAYDLAAQAGQPVHVVDFTDEEVDGMAVHGQSVKVIADDGVKDKTRKGTRAHWHKYIMACARVIK